ncbi:MAG: NPCBM/NEW2 domain-containing protein [Armatimonadetes bacterium]|nr:NPCBM/NEW2 domain-containing protein [Armatimonadota bacterium]
MLPFLLFASAQNPEMVRLEDMDLSNVRQGWGNPMKNKSVDGHQLKIGGASFEHGLGTHAVSVINIDLGSDPVLFRAMVGVDDEAGPQGDVDFHVLCDGVEKFNSGVMHLGDAAKAVSIGLKGVKKLTLRVGNGGDEINYDHADWADAMILHYGSQPKTMAIPVEKPYILTPKPPRLPRINGPEVLGARPGRDFVWRVPATGDRPMRFTAKGLPSSLRLDKETGVVLGKAPRRGTYTIALTATNAKGRKSRKVDLVVGDKIALTPPMGWNSWNCFATAVDEAKVRSAAKMFVEKGLVDHGWQYVNIDDCWSIIPHSNDPVLGGPQRQPDGTIRTNGKFPSMKELTDSIHKMGLRAGIYSSPGPTTCGGYTSSYKYEHKDAQAWADWGFDYLKYDWCSYSEVLKPEGLGNLQKPYRDMRAALDKVDRDIVFSLCQYGMGDVWKWGAEVGGNCWRTTGDINDSWDSMSGIGFSQNGHEKFAGPGHWNDPDMLVVGWVGWGPQLHPTKLTPSEQYTHITLWSLLSSPLLIGCDLTKLDDFTLNLLTNDEVLAVNQDRLGKPAHRERVVGDIEVWTRPLADGSYALGIFNRGDGDLDARFSASDVGLKGSARVRDLWRQKDMGVMTSMSVKLKSHGCGLFKLSSVR